MKAIALLFLCASFSAVALSWVSTRNTNRYMDARERALSQQPLLLQKGYSFAGTDLVDDAGRVEEWREAFGQWALVFVFTMNCEACDRVAPLWRDLISFLDERLPLDVVFLNTRPWQAQGAIEFMSRHRLEGGLFSLRRAKTTFKDERKLPFNTTPQTLLVNPEGVVVHTRGGRWSMRENDDWVVAIYESLGQGADG